MKKIRINFTIFILIIIEFILPVHVTIAQNASVGINKNGVAPNPKALLDIDASGMSSKAGILVPRMTTAERDAITLPIPESLVIYNTDTHCFEAYYNSWVACGCLGSGCQPPTPSTPGAIAGPTYVNAYNTYTFSISTIANAISYTWSVPCNATIISGQGTASINVSFTSVSTDMTYTSPGTYKIDCLKSATIEVIGGGGGGGNNGYGGGGGGGYSSGTFTGLSDSILTVTIGTGGKANWGGGAGTKTSVSNLISASGGGGGTQGTNNVSLGGAGGIGTGGTINHSGGKGGAGQYTYLGGGGGGAGGSTSNGSNGGTPAKFYPNSGWDASINYGSGGSGGGGFAGDGGRGACYNRYPINITATAPTYYGGGGGGGNGTSGSSNGNGITGAASNGTGGFCRIYSVVFGGNISVTSNNNCGNSTPRNLSITVDP